ncbi:MAG TPA: sugar nucleotide-binding protein, partial [Anaerolineales bacterium]|nr:sugar nucleotide-binding protein [Anaerolineales bacterium]
MKIVLFGKNGQLGWEFQRMLPILGEVISFDREELDLCDLDAVQKILSELKPNLIINASAYTDVDRAEKETDLVMKINALAPG